MTFLPTRLIDDSILPYGIMNLHVTFRDKPYSKIILTKFMIINIPLTYYAVIGQPTLNKLRMVILTY